MNVTGIHCSIGEVAIPEKMTVNEVLAVYGEQHEPNVRDPERIRYAIQTLTPCLGHLTIASLNGEVCRKYGDIRGKASSTIRKEFPNPKLEN